MSTAKKPIAHIPARATVTEVNAPEAIVEELRLTLAKADNELTGEALAALGPVGENNQPRMLQISAWICHAGQVNRNGYEFTEEGLKAAVASGLFAPPFVGMVDYNHDFRAIGAWHNAEFKYDPRAKAMGILAHGTIWSWRYTEQANALLAVQHNQGFIDVSVSVLFKRRSIEVSEGGMEKIVVHDPIFLTTSVLDVDPADPKANGLVSEKVTETADQRTVELLRASAVLPPDPNEEEPTMDFKELLAKLEEKLGEQKAELAPLVAAAEKLSGVEQELATATARVAELEGTVATLTQAKNSAETAKAEGEALLTAARSEVEGLNAEIEPLRAFKAKADEKEAATVAKAARDARMAEVPEVVIAALETNEKKDEIITEWMKLDAAQWEVRKASFVVATAKTKTLADRSAEEGLLVSGVEPSEGSFAIDKLRR